MSEQGNPPLTANAITRLYIEAQAAYGDVPKDVIDDLVSTGGRRMVTTWRKKKYEVYATTEGRLFITELGASDEA